MDNKDLMKNNDFMTKLSQYKTRVNPFPIQLGRKSDVQTGAQSTEPAQNSAAPELHQAGLPDALPSTNINLDDLSRQIMIAGMNALGMTNPSVQRQLILGDTSTTTMNPLVSLNNIPMSSNCAENLMNSVPDGSGLMQYRAPDIDSFTFDRSTGYRFDPTTGLHYDANSGFFVNVRLKVFMRWDPLLNTYLREPKRSKAVPSVISPAFQPLVTSPVTPTIYGQPSATTIIFPDVFGKLVTAEQSSLYKSNERSPVDQWSSKNMKSKSKSDDFSRSRFTSPPNQRMGSNEGRNDKSDSRSSSQSDFQHHTRESEEQESASWKRKRSRSPKKDSRKSDKRIGMTSNQRTRNRSRNEKSSSHSPDTKRSRSVGRGRNRRSSRSPARKQSRSHSRVRKRRSSRSPARKQSRSRSRGRKRRSTRSPARKRSRSYSRGRKRCSSRSPARKQSRSCSRESRRRVGMIPNKRSRRRRSSSSSMSPQRQSITEDTMEPDVGLNPQKQQHLEEDPKPGFQEGSHQLSPDFSEQIQDLGEKEEVLVTQDAQVSGSLNSSKSMQTHKGKPFCFKCGLRGHLLTECQVEGKFCYCCLKLTNHIAAECPQRSFVEIKDGREYNRKDKKNPQRNSKSQINGPDKREEKARKTEDQSNHKLSDDNDKNCRIKLKGNLHNFSKSGKVDVSLLCHKCGIKGHLTPDCAVEGKLCYYCMKISDHVSRECPEKMLEA